MTLVLKDSVSDRRKGLGRFQVTILSSSVREGVCLSTAIVPGEPFHAKISSICGAVRLRSLRKVQNEISAPEIR
jgi:hypothetical protein